MGEESLSEEISMVDISPEQYEKYRQKLKQMRMMDDTLMKCIFKDCKPAVEQMLRIILQRDDLFVESFSIGKEFKNLKGHSICMDILAVDKDGKYYNIEVQRDDRGADPRRVRFYAGMMDVEMLDKGDDYSTLRDSYVIFITENDIFKEGKPLYHFIRTEEESGKPLGDGSHIIYVNGSYVGDGPLGWFMSDLRESDPKKIHFKVFAERMDMLKNSAKGEKEMCKIMEELVEEGRMEGLQKGIQKGIQKGLRKGIYVLIRTYREFGLTNEQIIKRIMAEYDISESEAAKYVYSE